MGGNSSSLVASTLFYGVATIPPLVVGITYMFPGDLLASHREFFDDTSALEENYRILYGILTTLVGGGALAAGVSMGVLNWASYNGFSTYLASSNYMDATSVTALYSNATLANQSISYIALAWYLPTSYASFQLHRHLQKRKKSAQGATLLVIGSIGLIGGMYFSKLMSESPIMLQSFAY